jgi:uncharacterized membrane protein
VEVAGQSRNAVHADILALGRRSAERAADTATSARRIAYIGTAIYAALFVAAAWIHFESFHAVFTDLGSMAQAVWSTAHGHFLESTTFPGGLQRTRLAGHVDPFLALFVPLWWIWSSPLMLQVVQALAVSSGALPVYWLARKHLESDRAAAHFAFAYLLYPATQFSAFTITSGFHAVSMAVPLILYAIWFLDEERLLPFAIFALLAASTKEEIPLAVGCLGIWFAARSGRRLVGLTIFGLGLAVTLVDFLVIIPHFSPSGIDPFAARYSQVGTTPGGIFHKAFTDPGAFVHAVATGHKLVYVALLLGPFLGLWIRAPLLFLGAVPDLAINLLSSKGDQTVIVYHWTAGIVPFTVAASILGAAKLRRDPDQISLYALLGAACIAVVSPLTIGIVRGDIGAAMPSNSARSAKAHALGMVPSDARVAASNQLATYLSSRTYIYIYPFGNEKANWLVVDRNDNTYSDVKGYRRALRHLDTDRHWRVVYNDDGIEVLRRIRPVAG